MNDSNSLSEYCKYQKSKRSARVGLLWGIFISTGLMALHHTHPVISGITGTLIEILMGLIGAVFIYMYMRGPNGYVHMKLNDKQKKLLGISYHSSVSGMQRDTSQNASQCLGTQELACVGKEKSPITLRSPSKGRGTPGTAYNDMGNFDAFSARERMKLASYDSPSAGGNATAGCVSPPQRTRGSSDHAVPLQRRVSSPYSRTGQSMGMPMNSPQSALVSRSHVYHTSPPVSPMNHMQSPSMSHGHGFNSGGSSPAHSRRHTPRVLRDVMEVLGIPDDDMYLYDRGVDNLRKCLARHLKESLQRFSVLVGVISRQLEHGGFSREEAAGVLEFSSPGIGRMGMHQRAGTHSLEDYYAFASSGNLAAKQQDPTLGGTLLENLQKYESLLPLFHLPCSDGRQPSPASVEYAIQRCRELATDGRLGKFTWDGSQLEGNKDFLSDSELVVAIFMHYCDRRASWGLNDGSRTFSASHYHTDLAVAVAYGPGINRGVGGRLAPTHHHHQHPLSNVVLVQRARRPPHFNIYFEEDSSSMELVVPEGRQNSFLAIIFFLKLLSERSRDSSRSGLLSSPLKDLYMDICGSMS